MPGSRKHARTLSLQLQAFSCSAHILPLLMCAPVGLWPDVGFAFKAAHMPGQLGLFLGLSGVRLSSPADLLYTGIATHYIPEDQLQVRGKHALFACRKHASREQEVISQESSVFCMLGSSMCSTGGSCVIY
jgi:hypothetical protein